MKIEKPYISKIPIKWFGNRILYNNSKIRIVTVGLNPSFHELVDNNIDVPSFGLRFNYNKKHEDITSSYNRYFETNPYESWFKRSFEDILNNINASFFSGSKTQNIAIHTDFCSPYVTKPTWSKLNNQIKEKLFEEGKNHWHSLLTELKPNIILISIRKRYVDSISFSSLESNNKWEHFKNYENKKANQIETLFRKYQYDNGEEFFIFFSRAGIYPFFYLDSQNKKKFGSDVLSFIEERNKNISRFI